MNSVVRFFGLSAAPLALAGCALAQPPAFVQNPVSLANANYEQVWNDVVLVVERYFDIAYENRYDGRIETKPVVGATCFEPWRPDSTGCRQRLEATLQTIRRRAFVVVAPAPAGGFQVLVEVYKEIEDVQNPISAEFGGGSFISSIEPIREEVVSSPVEPGLGWISMGRDKELEARILAEIQQRLDQSLHSEAEQIRYE